MILELSEEPSALVALPDPAHYHDAGAELAACLAGAAAFRFWIERTTAGVNPFALDLFNLDETSGDPSTTAPLSYDPRLLDLLMVGAGSVGSACAYFLPRFGFRGNVDVVDLDSPTSPLTAPATVADIEAGDRVFPLKELRTIPHIRNSS